MFRITHRLGQVRYAAGNPVRYATNHIHSYEYTKMTFHMTDMMVTAAYDMQAAINIANEKILSKLSIQQANTIANELIVTNKNDFRDISQKTVQLQIQATTPHIPWHTLLPSGGAVPVFRSVIPTGNYGFPHVALVDGVPAAIFNTRSCHKVLVPASIVSLVPSTDNNGDIVAKLNIEGRNDMLGFVFGPNISTSLNVCHVLDERYMPVHLRYQTDRYIYLIALREGYSVGHGIYSGSGYIRNREAGLQGKKGVSCQEDGCEVGAGVYISNQQVLGVRKVSMDGTLSPFQKNENANQDLFAETLKYLDTRIFLEANSVEEVRYLEALLVSDPEKVEFYIKRMNGFHRLDQDLHRQIRLEAINRDNPSTAVCPLLQDHEEDQFFKKGNEHQFTLFYKSMLYNRSLRNGELIDAKKEAFHDYKSPTEEDLKKRVFDAFKR